MLQGVAHGAPRAEDGWGHSIASATDCLAMVELYDGDERALPIVQAIAGIAEVERHRPVNEPPAPASASEADLGSFRRAVEGEELVRAQALLRAAIARGDSAEQLIPWFSAVVSDHHLSYGHGAIYSQKAFQLLAMIGWAHADLVLTNLVPTLVYGTREDKLPYMRPFVKALAALDLDELTAIEPDPSWDGAADVVDVLLGGDRTAPVDAVVAALRAGAGVDRVLDCVVEAVSIRMLRYDTTGERVFDDDFGWLDITHGLTYANAARWHHRQAVGAGGGTTTDLLRLVMFTVFQANWTGRHEWHTSVGELERPDPLDADLTVAGERLQRESLLDGTSAFIVAAHAVKTSRAAAHEAVRLGSSLPLDATLRFMRAPKLERFVAATVARSIDFLNGRIQRD